MHQTKVIFVFLVSLCFLSYITTARADRRDVITGVTTSINAEFNKILDADSSSSMTSHEKSALVLSRLDKRVIDDAIKKLRENGFESFRMPSQSMQNTILFGDFVVFDLFAYKTEKPKRYDIVAYRLPTDRNITYAKRIIGLPNDIVKFVDGVVYVNGSRIQEEYIAPENDKRQFNGEFRVPDNFCFLVGDNRDHSNDSRFDGPVPLNDVYGRATEVWMSVSPDDGIRFDRIGKLIK